ncbi:hypothetical protein BDM02DRAFT_3132685 [Thelephora ganbajun]|uniref:Uncharacterized protein n=1 Tax=Thelephora ganbajun TaxID=370292 RepID=A0ACB6Z0Y2_THEGA|nr:hypothetical protein BDM02DRAFT_3132685 [Thelephora ganbajun]
MVEGSGRNKEKSQTSAGIDGRGGYEVWFSRKIWCWLTGLEFPGVEAPPQHESKEGLQSQTDSKKPNGVNEDSARLIKNLLSHLFLGPVFQTDENGKGKDIKNPKESSQKTNIAGTPESSNSLPIKEIMSSVESDIAKIEQVQVDHATALSSVECIMKQPNQPRD